MDGISKYDDKPINFKLSYGIESLIEDAFDKTQG